MAVKATLERVMFEVSRAAEYFSASELQAQTGQPREKFADVVLKEVVDNALDSAEESGAQPAVIIDAVRDDDNLTLTVADNGGGIAPETIERILNFETRTSSKVYYHAPTRGLQGNALKTVIGMPYALGVTAPITIRARGVEHVIHAGVDPAGIVRIKHSAETVALSEGTQISVTLPNEDLIFDPIGWARGYAIFNPHASVKIRLLGEWDEHAQDGADETTDFYPASAAYPNEWRRFLPTDATSPGWYDVAAFKRLVFGYIAERDITLRDFVRQFAGLTGAPKAKAVCDRFREGFPHIERLRDFEGRENEIAPLLLAMRTEARTIKPADLGVIGEAHFRACLDKWYGVKRLWYKKATEYAGSLPVVIEVAVAETESPGRIFTGVNFAPTFGDPYAGTSLRSPEIDAYGLGSFLSAAHVKPVGRFCRQETVFSAHNALDAQTVGRFYK